MTLLYIFIGLILISIPLQLHAQYKISKLRKLGLYPEKGKGTMDDVKKLINTGYKIEAIRLYREINKTSFKKAKQEIDKIILTRQSS